MALESLESLTRNPSANPTQAYGLLTLAQVLTNGPDTGGLEIVSQPPQGEQAIVSASATGWDADATADRSATVSTTGNATAKSTAETTDGDADVSALAHVIGAVGTATANQLATGIDKEAGISARVADNVGHFGIHDGTVNNSTGTAGTPLVAQGDGDARWSDVTAEHVVYEPPVNPDLDLGVGDAQSAFNALAGRVAAHVADGSTVDQLRDALVSAGLMAAS